MVHTNVDRKTYQVVGGVVDKFSLYTLRYNVNRSIDEVHPQCKPAERNQHIQGKKGSKVT